MDIVEVSSTTGQGFEAWCEWLLARSAAKKSAIR
jgi:hypothetical protein